MGGGGVLLCACMHDASVPRRVVRTWLSLKFIPPIIMYQLALTDDIPIPRLEKIHFELAERFDQQPTIRSVHSVNNGQWPSFSADFNPHLAEVCW